MGRKLNLLAYYKDFAIIILTPIIFLPLPVVVKGQEALCGYLLLIMGTYWCTEALPLGVTSLLPVFLMPLFGLMKTTEVCPLYFTDINMMLTGGLIMALAIEKCNLHKRIALNVLRVIGVSPRWLILGFMLPTWFLSMWISNTATSAMMMPIVIEVIQQMETVDDNDNPDLAEEGGHANAGYEELEIATISNGIPVSPQDQQEKGYPALGHLESETPNSVVLFPLDSEDPGMMPGDKSGVYSWDPDQQAMSTKSSSNMAKALVISIAFSANVGGSATLIGTAVNLIVKGQADHLWQDRLGTNSPLDFTTWMVWGMPISIINLFIVWFWLELWFVGPREFLGCGAKHNKQKEKAIKNVINEAHKQLGDVSSAEIQVIILFLILVLLWFLRDPGFIPGWISLPIFKAGYIEDAVPAILIGVVVFAIPAVYARFPGKGEKPVYLMDWAMMTEKFPWSVILLLGGGFALAEATTASGLSAWIGDKLTVFQTLPEWVMVMLLTYLVTLVTQFTSNTATASLMLPIVSSMAEQMNKNPLYLMLPVGVGTQFAFMLPVATPPNAVAYTSGYITVMDMVSSGFMLNIFCTLITTLAAETWGMSFFHLHTLPWATNNTITTTSPILGSLT